MFSAVTSQGDKLLIVANQQENQQPRMQNDQQPMSRSWFTAWSASALNYSLVECDLRNLNKNQFLTFLGHVNDDPRPIRGIPNYFKG